EDMGSGQSLGLPPGKGRYQVGCTDVMTDHTEKGCFFRLYYPCGSTKVTIQPLWIPEYNYCNGLAEFLNLNSRWCAPLLSVTFGSYRIPVHWNASFRSNERYPLIVFSHGLGAFRSVYSAVCMELASRGFIVAAVEHRDGSASATYFYKNNSVTESQAQYRLQQEWIPFKKLKEGEKEFHVRNPQVHQRANECVRMLDFLTDLCNGKEVTNILHKDFNLSELKDGLDLGKVAIMGHSFGASTAILALVKDARFKCAVALDAWMLPLENELYPEVKAPVFFINSEKFQTVDSIEKMKRLRTHNTQIKIVTILGAVHQSQTDFTFLTGQLLGKVFETRGTIDPYVALEINNRATLAFLQKHLDLKEDFDQWDALIEGSGEHLIPEAPLRLSSL
uniref:Platelet-activating factor acetylhydrolase n=1 Tax=Latimeria chalumnae TaxID=7897 RepID=H3BAS5_LATCH